MVLAVAYTWLLVIISLVLRVWVLRIVGVERSGSTLTIAAMLDDPTNRLKSLVHAGDMSKKSNFVDAIRKYFKQEMGDHIQLGVVKRSGRFGIGIADEVIRLDKVEKERNGDGAAVQVGQEEGSAAEALPGDGIDAGKNTVAITQAEDGISHNLEIRPGATPAVEKVV